MTNSGPADLSGVEMTDDFNADFAGDTYSASPSGGATGACSGNSNIDDFVDLPANSSIVYTVDATINSETPTLVNTASLSPPDDVNYSSAPSFSAQDFDDVGDCS